MIEQYADKFRLWRDECGDPFFKCAKGIVYDLSEVAFGIWLKSRKPMMTFNAMQAKWPALVLSQLGENEFTAKFEPSQAGEGLRFLRSIGTHKAREYSDEELQRLSERGKRLAASNRERAKGGKP